MPDNNKKTDLSRREIRRRRRVRNQMTAYISLGVLLVALLAGVFFGGRYLSERVEEKKEEERLAEELAAMEETETKEETEESETVEEYTEDDLLDEMIDAALRDMSLEDKVAGLFLTSPEALTDVDVAVQAGDGTEKALSEYAVGGLVYGAKNVKSESQFAEMLTNTVSMSKYPLFLILQEQAAGLDEDLTQYGINIEFAETGGGDIYETVSLPAEAAETEYTGVKAAFVTGEAEEIGERCLEAWQGGADLLFVPEYFMEGYQSLLEAISDGTASEEMLEASLERIYRIKYRGRLRE